MELTGIVARGILVTCASAGSRHLQIMVSRRPPPFSLLWSMFRWFFSVRPWFLCSPLYRQCVYLINELYPPPSLLIAQLASRTAG